MKRILDSVHGHISVDSRYFKDLIDTPHFQRLRHIEQTSTRSIFPSARHDRFIHSLGVFHIGNMICKHVMSELKETHRDHITISPARLNRIEETYRLACILHDVGHSPFSHTFENYYGHKEELASILKKELDSPALDNDLNEQTVNSPSPHEYASAILSERVYKQKIEELQGDLELLVRMIIGCKYNDSKKSLENCFIELIHGNVIDADRLDYACRDVWASGYSTSTIDLTRLIASIHIHYDYNKKSYFVCFDANALNEIESVVQVKDFQVRYTINHHKVILEQHLLTKAVGKLAMSYFNHTEIEDANDRETKALYDFFSIDSLTNSIPLTKSDKLYHISDGDIIYLMKRQEDNDYFQQWFSRQYHVKPIWKTPAEFFKMSGIQGSEELSKDEFDRITKKIVDDFNLQENQYLSLKVTYKAKVSINDTIFRLKDTYVKGKDLPFRDQSQPHDRHFMYLYIDNEVLKSKRDDIMEDLYNIRHKIE